MGYPLWGHNSALVVGTYVREGSCIHQRSVGLVSEISTVGTCGTAGKDGIRTHGDKKIVSTP